MFGLIRSSEDGWGSAPSSARWSAAAVLLVAFVVAEALQREPMFDLSLLRKPTFVGGLIAAFAISASLFSTFPYLCSTCRPGSGYSAIEVGVRFLVLSGADLHHRGDRRPAARTRADALPDRPGLRVRRRRAAADARDRAGHDWTHLIPGFIVAGIGAGLVNVPLASTAVGVVEPARAGMASGINSTFRQVGIATGVAALGAIFSHHAVGGRARARRR